MTAAAKSLQSCPTLCDPIDAAHQAPPSLGFSRQEHWSGLPFPCPMHERKSESEVAQSRPTLSDPMDCSPPGSSVHGIFQARVLEWVAKFEYLNLKLTQQRNREDKIGNSSRPGRWVAQGCVLALSLAYSVTLSWSPLISRPQCSHLYDKRWD